MTSRLRDIFEEAITTQAERADEYGENFLRFGRVMNELFPDGLTVKGVDEFNRLGVFIQIMSKLTRYVEKYGEDNAEYLMEMEQGWMKEYSRATYIDWGVGDSEKYKQYTRDSAEYLDWDYDEISGCSSLMQKLVDGQWDDKDFLVVEPGKKIEPDAGSENIIKAE